MVYPLSRGRDPWVPLDIHNEQHFIFDTDWFQIPPTGPNLRSRCRTIGSKYPVLAGKEYDALGLEQNVRKTQKTKKIIKYICIFFISIYPLYFMFSANAIHGG